MKNTNINSGNFAAAKFRTNSHRLSAIALAAVIGLSIAACQNDLTGGNEPSQGPNPFLGEWEGNVTSSAYESYGEIPVVLTISEDVLLLEVMGQSGEGTYTRNGNVMTIHYYGDPVGTGTLDAEKDEIAIVITDESFGDVTGTLRRKTSQPPGSMSVTIDFANVKDAEIILEDFTLEESDNLPVTVAENFAKYEWYINGVLADNALVSNGGKTITLSGGGNYLNAGNNSLSVKVTDNDGVSYSKTVIFTVE
ncbi:MAG: hypothetical protein LBU85_08275 [Treponema sp.]|jgi:hypothetical protein|nr:hypothetical protein [Treponema sp.]